MRPTTPSVRPSLLRCPACGQPVDDPPPSICPICHFDFADDRATGADVTPYAQTYARRERGWRVMNRWVWLASTERLKHLAMMRVSAASRRFMLIHITLAALGIGLFGATQVGWWEVTASSAVGSDGSIRPAGSGWLHVAAAPRPLPGNHPAELPADLWWNVGRGALGLVLGIVAGWILLRLSLAVLRSGATKAHTPSYRREQRMTAALDYSAAWCLFLLIAGLIALGFPLTSVGRVKQWWWCPQPRVIAILAGVIAAMGATLWWFWLIRLGATAPARTRGRVVSFFAVGTPILAAAAAAVWWLVLHALNHGLFQTRGVHF